MEGKDKMNTTESVLDMAAENSRRLKVTKMLDAIEFWYNNYGRNKFDPKFIKAMAIKHRNGLRLTDGQVNAIERTYQKWVKF